MRCSFLNGRSDVATYEMLRRLANNPDVRTVLTNYLMANGYDGLVSDTRDCACAVDYLAPCDSDCLSCTPGWRENYPKGDCPCGDGCEFHIFPGRRGS